ncbi:MAG TPA: hypothetical protein VLT47_14465 [Anaeromyxobacteraceae bacterium]|nr:hypothetical protein [Anaeromyxobacteraceae bacterium]
MRPRPLALALAAAAALTALPACRGAEARPVRIVLSLYGAAGRPVHGLDVTVALPEGTRVAFDPATGRVAPEALALRPGAAGATLDGHFRPHASAPSIRILLASTAPMRDGEVAAIDATVTSAVAPSVGRFEVARAAVSGPGGAGVPGATGWVSGVAPR